MARLHPAAKKRLEQARAKERQSMRNYDTEGTSGSESDTNNMETQENSWGTFAQICPKGKHDLTIKRHSV
jgi:hypothetical protein